MARSDIPAWQALFPRVSAARETVRACADRRLRTLVGHAASRSPHYRDLFASAGVRPEDIRTAADLVRLPMLDRATLLQDMKRIAVEGVDLGACPVERTNGTTGEPLVLPVTHAELQFKRALWLTGYVRQGLRPWHRQVRFAMAGRRFYRHALQRLGLFRRDYVSVALHPAAKVDWLRRHRPDAVFAWASVLNELCSQLEDEDARMNIPLVFSTSDMLWSETRRRIEQRLARRLVDVYGAMETGPLAWECPGGHGYHVDDRWNLVEIVDEDGRPATRGIVVCTSLWRRTVPVIRYRLVDVAEWGAGACPCGSAFPRLASLHGREYDLLRLPDGSRIAGTAVGVVMDGIPGIRQYQLIQVEPARVLLRITPGPGFDPDSTRVVAAKFRERFGEKLRAETIVTPHIHRPADGKFPAVVTFERFERMRQAGYDTSRFFA